MSERAVIYERVSTGRQAESGLSLEDQSDRCAAAIASRGWVLIDEFIDAGLSGKSLDRPALNRALEMLDAGEADVLVVSAMSRLVRSIVDLDRILTRSAEGGWSLVILDVQVDTSTPVGRMVLNIVGSVAQFEREIIGERTAMSHRVRRARGVRSGQAPLLPDEIRHRIAADREAGETLQCIADALNAEGVPTARGGRAWHRNTVSQVCQSVALDTELAGAREAS